MKITFNVYQGRDGSIYINNGKFTIDMCKDDCCLLDLYSLEDFSEQKFNEYYNIV